MIRFENQIWFAYSLNEASSDAHYCHSRKLRQDIHCKYSWGGFERGIKSAQCPAPTLVFTHIPWLSVKSPHYLPLLSSCPICIYIPSVMVIGKLPETPLWRREWDRRMTLANHEDKRLHDLLEHWWFMYVYTCSLVPWGKKKSGIHTTGGWTS